jgi:hypothetical protein
MIFIEVEGGTQKEKELVTEVAYWCQKKLLPRIRKLDMIIKIQKLDIFADVLHADDRVFYMRLRRGMSLYDIVSTVCHEMVHVKQYVKGELRDMRQWKSRRVSDNTSYADLPWEKEAYKMEEGLALECFKELTFVPR